MRTITKKAVAAFLAGQTFREDNTRVEVSSTEANLFLHGNLIARRYLMTGETEITTAGWNTTTTKERLNGLPGVRLHTKAYQLYLNDKPWDGSWTTVDANGNTTPS